MLRGLACVYEGKVRVRGSFIFVQRREPDVRACCQNCSKHAYQTGGRFEPFRPGSLFLYVQEDPRLVWFAHLFASPSFTHFSWQLMGDDRNGGNHKKPREGKVKEGKVRRKPSLYAPSCLPSHTLLLVLFLSLLVHFLFYPFITSKRTEQNHKKEVNKIK